LGAVLALDPVSCVVAAVVFGIVVMISRYVSLSSLVGGLAFVAAHFFRDAAPFSREHIAMSLFSIAVVTLLVIRHRANLARIWAGTESRVQFRRPRPASSGPPQPSGRITIALLVVIGLLIVSLGVVGGFLLVRNAKQPIEVNAGPWTLRQTDRVTTGQQRVDRVAFTADGNRLAAICPRYNHLLVYHVESDRKLSPIAAIALQGRPVALAALGDRFIVLQRPAGDQKHLEPGWWEVFDRDGQQVGSRTLAGYYPDDLAISPDGRFLHVLCSGRAEGDDQKPLPDLEIIAVDPEGDAHHLVGRVIFDRADDPQRLTLSASGCFAAVFLAKCKQTAAVDLSRRESPRLIGRAKPASSDAPYVSFSSESDWIMMPVAADADAVVIGWPGDRAVVRTRHQDGIAAPADFLVCTRQQESVLELLQVTPRRSLGRLPLRGPLNLGRTRPTGLAYSAERGLLAVATRSGTIHLIELRSRVGSGATPLEGMAKAFDGTVRR
jgi:glycerol-3-phosphate acyltransferase PlsY